MKYVPPTPADLRKLKESLGYTGQQMADLMGLAGNSQWRKYTGGDAPREMSAHMLFFAAAKMELDEATIERVLQQMREWGAEIELPMPARSE
jgi:transcriptional regulator with XRE-family HTH domain